MKQCSLITVPPDPLTFKLRHDLIVSPRRMNISDNYRKTVFGSIVRSINDIPFFIRMS